MFSTAGFKMNLAIPVVCVPHKIIDLSPWGKIMPNNQNWEPEGTLDLNILVKEGMC